MRKRACAIAAAVLATLASAPAAAQAFAVSRLGELWISGESRCTELQLPEGGTFRLQPVLPSLPEGECVRC